MRRTLLAVVFGGALALTGCNTLAGQPHFREAAISPAAVPQGQAAVITASLKDKNHTVAKVEGTVKEDPRLKFKLRDDGKDPDKKAGDGTWTIKVDVPPTAPPGQFTVDLTAYNSKGQPVLVRPKDSGAQALAQSLTFSIEAAASK